MKNLSDHELNELVDRLSREFFSKPFIDTARYNYRLRSTGGRYIPSLRCIEVNPKYVQEMPYNEVIGIIKHELVHYHLHIEGKPYGHRDQEFRQLLKETNSPRFCRPLPSTLKKQTFHLYTCTSCGTKYKRRRRVNVERVRCGKCNERIAYEFSTKSVD